jgi:beta-phosphoglucomutase-like phosphatase (HAD superfamily)
MFTTAIFDLEGLLLDSERLTREVWKKIITDQGLVFDHAFYETAVGLNVTDTRTLFREHYGVGFDFDEALSNVGHCGCWIH